MSIVKDIQTLLEVQSLHRAIRESQKRQQGQHERMHTLKMSIESRKTALLETKAREVQNKKDLLLIETQLSKSQNTLEQLRSRENQLKTQDEVLLWEKSVHAQKLTLEEQELKALDLMNQLEEVAQEIIDDEAFIKGSAKTVLEIQKEVDEALALEDKEQANYLVRVQNLLSLCAPKCKSQYEILHKRFPEGPVISRLEGKHCQNCVRELGLHLQGQVEQAKSLEQCPHCLRLLAPTAAFS